MNADLELVHDTLYDRKQGERQSCLVVNEAGVLLVKKSESIIPAIERVLREQVEPVLSERPNRVKDPALERVLGDYSNLGMTSAFPGLAYVLGAYLVIGAKSNPERTIAFLSGVSRNLLIEAIAAIPQFFRRMNGGYNFGVSPQGRILDFVVELVSSGQEDVRIAAARALDQLTENERP